MIAPIVEGVESSWERVTELARELPTTALMVVAGGQVVLEYGDTGRASYLASARKSVLSMLYGWPVVKGAIDLDATMAEIGIDDVEGLRPAERRATVRDLLTARSGVYHPAANPGSHELPPRGSVPPGTRFVYNNWDFNVLGAVFERLTGRGVFEALADDLAGPLGFQDFDPARQRLLGQPEWSRHLAHHMWLSARDLARVGLLMNQGGVWQGEQLLPADWLAQSTSVQVDMGPTAPFDYGYLWWLPRRLGGWLALGNYGQYLLCLPSRDLVVVHRRAIPDEFAIARNMTNGANSAKDPEPVTHVQFMELVRAILSVTG